MVFYGFFCCVKECMELMLVCMPMWMCVYFSVAVVSLGCRGPFVWPWVMWSRISIPVFVWPCCPCSPVDRRPSSYLSCSLNCGPQCRDPVTFSNNGEINSAPPITLSASHPANEGAAWGLCLYLNQSFNQRKHSHTKTHTQLIQWYQWQPVTTTHTLLRDTLQIHTWLSHKSWERHQLFHPDISSCVGWLRQRSPWQPIKGSSSGRMSRDQKERRREKGWVHSFKDTHHSHGHVRT